MIMFLEYLLLYTHERCLRGYIGITLSVHPSVQICVQPVFFISSPELKTQVSFSDHLSSVVCLSVCLSVRLSVCLSVCLSVRLSVRL